MLNQLVCTRPRASHKAVDDRHLLMTPARLLEDAAQGPIRAPLDTLSVGSDAPRSDELRWGSRHLEQDSSLGVVPPEHVWSFLETHLVVTPKEGGYWSLVGRGQGAAKPPCTQDSPHNKDQPRPECQACPG